MAQVLVGRLRTLEVTYHFIFFSLQLLLLCRLLPESLSFLLENSLEKKVMLVPCVPLNLKKLVQAEDMARREKNKVFIGPEAVGSCSCNLPCFLFSQWTHPVCAQLHSPWGRSVQPGSLVFSNSAHSTVCFRQSRREHSLQLCNLPHTTESGSTS